MGHELMKEEHIHVFLDDWNPDYQPASISTPRCAATDRSWQDMYDERRRLDEAEGLVCRDAQQLRERICGKPD